LLSGLPRRGDATVEERGDIGERRRLREAWHAPWLAACYKQMRDGFNRLDEIRGPDMTA
jgi:hypothetical protein